LRKEVESSNSGIRIDQEYMAAMRRAGVKRAFLEIDSIWRRGKPEHARTTRRLLFSQYDGPDSQIIDSNRLRQIEIQGLDAILDALAYQRVSNAHLFQGFEGRPVKSLEGKPMYSYVEFMADAQLPEQNTVVSPSGKWNPVVHAAYLGDVIALEKDLVQNPAKSTLNRALLDAVLNPYDNTQAIVLLIRSGADVNFHGHHGVTPLMNAVPHACNVRALIELGARVADADKWGRTALDLAKQEKQDISVQLLLARGSQ
jgi:hypothetical protein